MRKYDITQMSKSRAFTFCCNLFSKCWAKLDSKDIYMVWGIILSYVQNNFMDIDVLVPSRLVPAWEECKELIDEQIINF